MRLEITRRSDLATRALLELARTGERTKASVLADRVGTTPGFLSQAMTPLVAQGWVRSDPGPTGGYTVLVDPAALTVLEVIEAVEGPTDTGRCVLEDRPCAGTGAAGLCALHRPWSGARAQLLVELDRTPLSSLLEPETVS
ncbi:MAG TPA: Rrf2 family transcriptional regulator [Acidimicrobiales bacterium]